MNLSSSLGKDEIASFMAFLETDEDNRASSVYEQHDMLMMGKWFDINEQGCDNDDSKEVSNLPQHDIDDVFDYYFDGSSSSCSGSNWVNEKELLSVPTDIDDVHYHHFGGLEVIEEETEIELLFEEMVDKEEKEGGSHDDHTDSLDEGSVDQFHESLLSFISDGWADPIMEEAEYLGESSTNFDFDGSDVFADIGIIDDEADCFHLSSFSFDEIGEMESSKCSTTSQVEQPLVARTKPKKVKSSKKCKTSTKRKKKDSKQSSESSSSSTSKEKAAVKKFKSKKRGNKADIARTSSTTKRRGSSSPKSPQVDETDASITTPPSPSPIPDSPHPTNLRKKKVSIESSNSGKASKKSPSPKSSKNQMSSPKAASKKQSKKTIKVNGSDGDEDRIIKKQPIKAKSGKKSGGLLQMVQQILPPARGELNKTYKMIGNDKDNYEDPESLDMTQSESSYSDTEEDILEPATVVRKI